VALLFEWHTSERSEIDIFAFELLRYIGCKEAPDTEPDYGCGIVQQATRQVPFASLAKSLCLLVGEPTR
jgi:hypothetical protein